jgi:D-lactate dehydrogenase
MNIVPVPWCCLLLQDPAAHMQFLKPSPPASSLIDNCMECGYCEAFCPSRQAD